MRGSIPEEYSHPSSGARNNPYSLSLLYLTVEQVYLLISPLDSNYIVDASLSVYSRDPGVDPTCIFTNSTETRGILRVYILN